MSLNIYIKGMPAAIKAGSSFDFVKENPMFTDADDYSLNIEFPIKDCPQNVAAFGFVNVPGAAVTSDPFDMLIVSGKIRLEGVGVFNSVTETMAKVQFLGRRSADNYKSSLDDVYINCLDLGELPPEYWMAKDVSVKDAWQGHAAGREFVAIPWVNEGTGDIINNTRTLSDSDGSPMPSVVPGDNQIWRLPDEADDDPTYRMPLAWMPYLIFIAKKICVAVGYDYDFSAWEASKWYHLLMCNCVPAQWSRKWEDMLPGWSVLEFFRNLEPLIEGSFDIDKIRKKIVFHPFAGLMNEHVESIEDVFDEFSSDVFEKEEECKLISQRFMGYEIPDCKASKMYSCEWLMRYYKAHGKMIHSFDTAEDLRNMAIQKKWASYKSHHSFGRDDMSGECSYVVAEDRYVSPRVILMTVRGHVGDTGIVVPLTAAVRVPSTLNAFGPRCVPEDEEELDSPDESIKLYPAVIDDTDNRRMVFVPLPENSRFESDEPIVDEDNSPIGTAIYDTLTMRYLEAGKKDKTAAYFSGIAVGFWPDPATCVRRGFEIFPIIDYFDMILDWRHWHCDRMWTLSLKSSDGKFAGIGEVNNRRKFEFSFLSDSLPDPCRVFMIKGHRYLCEKITASFSESGMSQKLKGVFWRLDG